MLRNPDSLSKTDIVIEDPVMEPYFITKSENGGYTVFEKITRGEDNNEYYKTISYPTHFNSALKAVAKELLHRKDGECYETIKDYIKAWDKITDSFKEITTLG